MGNPMLDVEPTCQRGQMATRSGRNVLGAELRVSVCLRAWCIFIGRRRGISFRRVVGAIHLVRLRQGGPKSYCDHGLVELQLADYAAVPDCISRKKAEAETSICLYEPNRLAPVTTTEATSHGDRQ